MSARQEKSRPKPFRTHSHVVSHEASGGEHISNDNLVGESNSLYAKRIQQQQHHRYTSLLNLSVTANYPSKSALRDSEAPAKPKRGEQHQRKALAQQPQQPTTKVAKKKSPAPRKPPDKDAAARDSSLHHLGRMSPEEQVDKFLQSVGQANAKTEGKVLASKEKGSMFNKNRKHRTANLDNVAGPASGGGGNNRWRSMDNLTLSAGTQQETKQKQLPPFNKPVKSKKNSPSAKLEASRAVGFRDINGPKSFASLSELDRIQEAEDRLARKNVRGKAEEGIARRPAAREARGKRTTTRSEEEERKKLSVGSSSSSRKLAATAASAASPASKSLSAIKTNVTYLGKLPLSNQASNLASLQLPLKELYFNFIQNTKSGQRPALSSLMITESGLKINYVRENFKGTQEIFNPFPTIAVWAAVRFIYKRELSEGRSRFLFAFLPLISDPGDAEKDQVIVNQLALL